MPPKIKTVSILFSFKYFNNESSILSLITKTIGALFFFATKAPDKASGKFSPLAITIFLELNSLAISSEVSYLSLPAILLISSNPGILFLPPKLNLDYIFLNQYRIHHRIK